MTEHELFQAALDLPDPTARAAYLDAACAGDPAGRARIDALLRSHESAGSFLATPAAGGVTPAGTLDGSAAAAGPADSAAAMTIDHSDVAVRGSAAAAQAGAAASLATSHTAGPHPGRHDDLRGLLTPSSRPDSLGRLGHHEVLQVLGQGGFGIVFRALDDVLQRVVAVKMLAPEMAATSPARQRFLREARASAAVRHENVVQVYEVGERPLPHLVMEFIPGETLQQKLDRSGPLDVRETLRIGRQIAEGLAAAHASDLIHRDIKPGNVLLEGGTHRVKITDFGLARAADDASVTQSGLIAGTPLYMAPEQALGQSLDQRADLFSLGSVIYQMVTGRPPFRASTTLAVMKRVAEDTPRPIREIIPEAPQWLGDIIAKLHAKNPAERFASAREVADVLADCEAQLAAGSKLRDYSRIPRVAAPRARWPRNRAAAAVVAAAAVLLVGALAVTEFAGVTRVFRGPPAGPAPATADDGPWPGNGAPFAGSATVDLGPAAQGEPDAAIYAPTGFAPAHPTFVSPTTRPREGTRPAERGFLRTLDHPLTSFAADVDTGAYAAVRRLVNLGKLPPAEVVRTEELVNAFAYRYPASGKGEPVVPSVEVAGCPWNAEHRLVRIGLKARDLRAEPRAPTHLVFLVDTSPSMALPSKLPLLKRGLRSLVGQLGPTDRVSIVSYAGATGGLVLSPTPAADREAIAAALDALVPATASGAAEGLALAYQVARSGAAGPGGVARVVLCTDGNFNVGPADDLALTTMVGMNAQSGVSLGVIGVGLRDGSDLTPAMALLAGKGRGTYATVDDVREARAALLEQAGAPPAVAARDVRLRVEFNPAVAGAYRLIGYEGRRQGGATSSDDLREPGDLLAGQTVTALYEVVPPGKEHRLVTGAPAADALKYQRPTTVPAGSGEVMTVRVQYVSDGVPRTAELPVIDGGAAFAGASDDFRFASAVAAFGMVLRDSAYKGAATLDAVERIASQAKGADPGGQRAAFVELVKRAKAAK